MTETLKKELRKLLLKQRNSLNNKEIKEKSYIIKKNLFSLDIYKKAKSILYYYSFNNEVSTIDMINESLSQNKIISLPLISNNNIETFIILKLSELKKNHYGIIEPDINKCKKQIIDEIDIIIIPGIAFDINGNRLGFGKGYYDRFLKNINSKTVKISICYDFQLKEKIPITKHAISVDIIITEEEYINLCKIAIELNEYNK